MELSLHSFYCSFVVPGISDETFIWLEGLTEILELGCCDGELFVVGSTLGEEVGLVVDETKEGQLLVAFTGESDGTSVGSANDK